MAGIWVYSEDAALAQEIMTLGTKLAADLKQPLCAVTLNEDVAKKLVALGAVKTIVLKSDCTWPEGYEQAIAETLQAEAASVVLIGGSCRGKLTAAKVAARLEAGLATDASNITLEGNELIVERTIFGGLAVSTEGMAFPALVTIAPRSYDVMAPNDSLTGEITVKEVTVSPGVTIGAVEKIQRQGVSISEADRVIGVGRGVGKQEDLALIHALADAWGAEIGCSRPIAEDAKWFPVETYIGISGQKFTGSAYLAVGISGQIQHVSGIRDSKIIVAINSDENAPIFAAADYGIVGSLYDIVPLLTEAIKQAK